MFWWSIKKEFKVQRLWWNKKNNMNRNISAYMAIFSLPNKNKTYRKKRLVINIFPRVDWGKMSQTVWQQHQISEGQSCLRPRPTSAPQTLQVLHSDRIWRLNTVTFEDMLCSSVVLKFNSLEKRLPGCLLLLYPRTQTKTVAPLVTPPGGTTGVRPPSDHQPVQLQARCWTPTHARRRWWSRTAAAGRKDLTQTPETRKTKMWEQKVMQGQKVLNLCALVLIIYNINKHPAASFALSDQLLCYFTAWYTILIYLWHTNA